MVGLMAEKTKRYLIIVTELDEDKLTNALKFADVPDAIGEVLDALTPTGALDTKTIYLLDGAQKDRVTCVLNHNALPYAELLAESVVDVTRPPATVLYLHDRRQRMQNPGDDTRPV